MSDKEVAHGLEDIHFPQRLTLIKNLRLVSFFINDIVLVISCVILFIWVTTGRGLQGSIFEKLSIVPASSILFILAGIALFFGAKRHIAHSNEEQNENYPWWSTWIPVFFASATSLLSLLSMVGVASSISELFISRIAGGCFLLIGLALIPPFTRIPHRFHITQFLTFIVSAIAMFVVLENSYQLFSGAQLHNTFFSFSLGLTLAFFCLGILLRWSNRGFLGNFTLDSTGSMFGFRIFTINLVAVPVITLIAIVFLQGSDIYQLLSVIGIFFTFVSSFLIWLNMKLLYSYELEHLLMRESLRTHNIDLTADKERLEEKMLQIEREKQQYREKLTTQDSWKEAIENTE